MRIPVALLLAVVLIPALGLAGVGAAQAQPLQVSPVPIWGVVLGTIVVAGLLYLLVHGPDGAYYRYPYYGEYYQHYYRPSYRPYMGYYLAFAPVVTVAPVIVGTVLGIVTLGSLEYILSRDAYGHLYRYPYYGPYRQVYYRSYYQPYHGTFVMNGSYRSAPVRQGDARWDNDRRILAPAYQRPGPNRTFYQQRQPAPQPRPSSTNQRWQPRPSQQQRPNSTYQQQPGPSQPRPNSTNQRRQPGPTQRQYQPGQGGGQGNGGGQGRGRQQQCGQQGQPTCPNNVPGQ